MKNSVAIACFYGSSKREATLHKEFMNHLTFMKNDGIITYWHTAEIGVGMDQQQEIASHLQSAELILLLITPNFTSSDHYKSIEKQAMERHQAGNARVIPIYLIPVDWRSTPLANLEYLPSDGRPVTSWRNYNEAFLDITAGIERVIHELRGTPELSPQTRVPTSSTRSSRHIISNAPTNSASSSKPSFPQFLLQIPYIPLLLVIVAISGLFIAYRSMLPEQHSSPTSTSSAQGCGSRHDDLVCTYNGHAGQEVYGVSWSPNGTRIASGSYDKKVQIWDPAVGNTIVSYSGHTEAVYAVAWSPDGGRIASGSSDGTVQVWDITGSPLRTYHGHVSTVYAVAWSPDGKRIASGGQDETVQVWDASTGKTITTYKGHISSGSASKWVNTIAWSPDGKRIASGSYDKTVQVWDAQTGQTLRVYKEHPDTVYALAWSPDGKFIASSGGGKVQVWSPDTGMPSFTYIAKAWSIAWSPSSKFIVIGTDNGSVQGLDSIHGTPSFTYPGSPGRVYTVAWSSEGTRIASGGTDGVVRVWQIAQF
jgi:hypothetical protein